MQRRRYLALAAGAAAGLGGCLSSDPEPEGTLITGDVPADPPDDDPETTTEPRTTSAADVIEGIDYDVAQADGGGTRTEWAVRNRADLAWTVTVVSTLVVEATETTTTHEDVKERRVSLAAGEERTFSFVHDVPFDAWKSFSFDVRDLERA
jgi:hypothetical protein